ncbi:metallophosphatase [Persicobacter psychrovividus]|uniref:Metallophosphatase n=1 Tax=Persicobacter psychrovividus TaxID=387638 RepID=A0ABM7VG66_9BACT|nr:metallophosphatase [Persicobacter psychrovividus]
MERRKFLKKSALGALFASVAAPTITKAASKKNDHISITLLHTGDTHSRIEAFPKNSADYPNEGGYAARAALVEKIRQDHENVLLFDSGDIVQGTPYFNFYKGELEMKLMSKMHYDAANLGNHEFDNGLEGIRNMLQYAEFPFICSNYDFSETILKDRFQPYKVFERQGVKIGVFGLGVELDGMVWDKNYGKTKYLDPIKVSQKMVKELRQDKGCDLVVCLSHLGYKYDGPKMDDVKVAQAVSGLDIILGGHSHTFMDAPVYVKNPQGEEVLINHSGWSGVRIGKIQVTFDRKKKKSGINGKNVQL